MKKIAVLLASTGMLVSTFAFAANTTAPATTTPSMAHPTPMTNPNNNAHTLNIGVINLADVLKNSPQMKVAGDNLRKNFKPRQEKILALQKDLEADQDKLKRNTSVMSQNDIQALQNSVNDKRRNLERLQEDYMQDLQTAQQQAMQTVLQQLDKIVQNIAAQGHYDLILQRNNVAYASPRVDITSQVIAQMK